ncbi:chromate efflux transporter [Stappia indica]|uniref:chromate efflux transporter n=1 Tax=Stappia indica TaxID=538381 RepID=UPI001D17E296|nr:chromate efflux transporter [Stappia indica]MCC4246969.1 chromate efflux transporter [Stappia indica]
MTRSTSVPRKQTTPPAPQPHGSAGEVFRAFLKLGLTSFGGPIAHLGYFREELVLRRKWLDEAAYADLVALCQFLPGPASSQVGFALGLMRAGPLGALAAWTAFTLPSALLLVAFALSAPLFADPLGQGLVSGLKLVAVAIIAHAVLGMAKALCPDRERATLAFAAAAIVLLVAGPLAQVAAIALAALIGLTLKLPESAPARARASRPPISRASVSRASVSRTAGLVCLALFFVLLVGLPLAQLAAPSQALAVLDAFYRAGALVFGGGHVVLPLLEAEVVSSGWVGAETFLAGYGAAQAVPGPLFTFAAYLGAVIALPQGAVFGAALALVAIFLPGLLLLVGVLPFWQAFRARPFARAAMAGANAAVVGILGAALYDPVFTSAVTTPAQFTLALACFVLLTAWKAPPWVAVLVAGLGGMLIGAA